MRRFVRYIGVDYSGAETARSSLKGLRVYCAVEDGEACEVMPPPSPRKYWSRREIAEWLSQTLAEDVPTIVGIDHGFSFPMRYFERHRLPPDWTNFLDDFCAHWPTDADHTYVDFVREGSAGNGAARMGERRWRRLTEEQAGGAKSVFHFDVQGQVAKSTHAGIPWLRYLRREVGARLHCWPFDGWMPDAGVSVLAEAYPALYRDAVPTVAGTRDQQDAFAIAAWLQQADVSGVLDRHFNPELTPAMRAVAQVEGWILGVDGGSPAPRGSNARRRVVRTRSATSRPLDTTAAAREFLARRIQLEPVSTPPTFRGVDTSALDVYRVVEWGREGSVRYVGVSRITGEAQELRAGEDCAGGSGSLWVG
jgi:hypothetical protein